MSSTSSSSTIADMIANVREKFAYIDRCPFTGERIFFENAGGALTLNTVVETSAKFAAIPDNQGRENPASQEMSRIIEQSKADMKVFFNAESGQFFVGESGTELLFRLIATAILGGGDGGNIVGSTLEHPASRSACQRWAKIANKQYIQVPHSDETGSVSASDYRPHITPETKLATILHTSPVTGMAVDIAEIAHTIRQISPDCFIIVDGIQHACHGQIDIAAYDIDGYVISPYKVFSRHGYGVAWISDRLTALPHNALVGGPATNWEMGTRDTGAYATFSDVVNYFDWLGGHFTTAEDRRAKIVAAGKAIHQQERALTEGLLHGVGNRAGLAHLPQASILGGSDNPLREGLVSFSLAGVPTADIVKRLNDAGIRTHIRKDDHYSGNILKPLRLADCVRVSVCHYNSQAEIAAFLDVMSDIASPAA